MARQRPFKSCLPFGLVSREDYETDLPRLHRVRQASPHSESFCTPLNKFGMSARHATLDKLRSGPMVIATYATLPRTQETAMPNPDPDLNPGDEAKPGTPGTGEDVCPTCHGSGRVGTEDCETCGGSGEVIRAIGGA